MKRLKSECVSAQEKLSNNTLSSNINPRTAQTLETNKEPLVTSLICGNDGWIVESNLFFLHKDARLKAKYSPSLEYCQSKRMWK